MEPTEIRYGLMGDRNPSGGFAWGTVEGKSASAEKNEIAVVRDAKPRKTEDARKVPSRDASIGSKTARSSRAVVSTYWTRSVAAAEPTNVRKTTPDEDDEEYSDEGDCLE